MIAISALLLLGSSPSAEPPIADVNFRCVPASSDHNRSIEVEVFYESVNGAVVDARLVVTPISGFGDPLPFELNNIRQMRLMANPSDPSAGSFIWIASGMGGEGDKSPWRFSLSMRDTDGADKDADAFLSTGAGVERKEFPMKCDLQAGAIA